MKALFIIIYDLDNFENLLQKLAENGFTGGTIFETQGMASNLAMNYSGSDIVSSFSSLLNKGRPFNRTLLMLLSEEKVHEVQKCVYEIVGDLSKGQTGVLFTLDISHIEGLHLL